MASTQFTDFSKFSYQSVRPGNNNVAGSSSRVSLSKKAFDKARKDGNVNNLLFVAMSAMTHPKVPVTEAGRKNATGARMLQKRLVGRPIDVLLAVQRYYWAGKYADLRDERIEILSEDKKTKQSYLAIEYLSVTLANSSVRDTLTNQMVNQNLSEAVQAIGTLSTSPSYEEPPKFALDEYVFNTSDQAQAFAERYRAKRALSVKSRASSGDTTTEYQLADLQFVDRVQKIMQKRGDEIFLNVTTRNGQVKFSLGKPDAEPDRKSVV